MIVDPTRAYIDGNGDVWGNATVCLGGRRLTRLSDGATRYFTVAGLIIPGTGKRSADDARFDLIREVRPGEAVAVDKDYNFAQAAPAPTPLRVEWGKNYQDLSGAVWLHAKREDADEWRLTRKSDGAICKFRTDGAFMPETRERAPSDMQFDLTHEVQSDPQMDLLRQGFAPQPELNATGGNKNDSGKLRMELIAPELLTATADILTFGAQKYAARNWELGMDWSRPFGAMMRHLWAWWAGDAVDAETGKSHLWHAACCLMFLIAYESRKTGNDDRHKQP